MGRGFVLPVCCQAVKCFTVNHHDTVKHFTGKSFYDKMQEDELERSPLVPLRERVGLTQEALANKLGVTDHTVRNWEKGRHEPKLTIRQVKALCAALKCTLEELPDNFAQIKNAETP